MWEDAPRLARPGDRRDFVRPFDQSFRRATLHAVRPGPTISLDSYTREQVTTNAGKRKLEFYSNGPSG